jgi:hypothetical protein
LKEKFGPAGKKNQVCISRHFAKKQTDRRTLFDYLETGNWSSAESQHKMKTAILSDNSAS